MQHEVIDIRASLQRALELRDADQLSEASELCRRVVAAAPRHEGARYLLGVLALQQGQLAEAEAALREAVALAPALLGAHLNLGLTLRRLGRPEAAIESYDRALELDPGNAEAQSSRGAALLDLKRFEAALASFDAALAADPTAAATLHDRGNALMGLERAAAALASYDAALAASPDHVEALANRAVALLALARPQEALASCEAAITLRAEDPMLWFGRGNALARLGRMEEAIAAYDRVAAGRPDFREAIYNRGLARLALGRFGEGWRDYEARWEVPDFVRGSSNAIAPALRARFEPEVTVDRLSGRRVLIVGEQGVGDVIMFASIVPDLIAAGASVTLVCEPRLRRLLAGSFPQIEVRRPVDADARPDAHDYVLPIGSLGRLFRNRAEDFPGAPYLSAGAQPRERWAARLGPREGRLRIGLSWRGGISRTRRDERSLPLSELGPVLDLPGCEFVSLQYGDVAAEIETENARRERPIRRFAPAEIEDFDDFAGLVQSLDLVVSVQTTVVHLSGALGVPCLVMTPSQPEWRYAAAAPALPWYKCVTVFRQSAAGDWASVLEPVGRVVGQRLAHAGGP